MKKCSKCKIPKDEKEFYKQKSNKDGLYTYCKSCSHKNTVKYYTNNMEKIKGYRAANKVKVFEHYGSICCICGEADLDVLTVDHINNDGASHRRILFAHRPIDGHTFYQWLITNNFPNEFQVLCRNCNWKKHLQYRRMSIGT